MDAYIRRDKFKLHVYICIYFLTVVKVASSSSFIGASIILLYFLVPFIRKMILKIDFRIMLIGYIFLFVGIVFFSTVVLNLEPVKFFIEDILGKNVTLTNAVSNKYYDALVYQKPIIVSKGTTMEKITQGFSYCVTQDKFDCEDLIQWYENLNHENIKRLCASKLNKVKDDMDIFTKRVEKFLQV